ncbi:hypothetical protein AcV7_003898 [Taiwanofungus camphoratus]|nr:hypothetical protein AcV7_003898 [Antrodia cinnamomea]
MLFIKPYYSVPSTTTEAAQLEEADDKWVVMVKRQDTRERVLRVNHLVFATGIGDGTPNMRAISGTASTLVSSSALQAKFKGHVLHSSQYRNIKGYENKNVVVGTGDSGYDQLG